MAKAWAILVAAHLVMPLAEPACPEGDACPVPQDDTHDDMSMLQNQRLLVKSSSTFSGGLAPSESSAEAPGCSSELDVAYGSEDKQKVDVYWPEDAASKPSAGWTAVIIMPGKGATRKHWKGFCTKYMVPAGRLCVAADYRQGDDYRVDDVFKFATWFYDEAPRWEVDKTKIVLGGASQAGLSLNGALWDKKMNQELLSDPPKVRAVMLFSGTWSGHVRKVKKAKYLPEDTLIITSDNDKVVPNKYSKDLYKELAKRTDNVKYVEIKDGKHSVWSIKPDEWFAEILTFLEEIVPVGNSYS